MNFVALQKHDAIKITQDNFVIGSNRLCSNQLALWQRSKNSSPRWLLTLTEACTTGQISSALQTVYPRFSITLTGLFFFEGL